MGFAKPYKPPLAALRPMFIPFMPPLTDTAPVDPVEKDMITALDVLTEVIVIVPAVEALPDWIDLIGEEVVAPPILDVPIKVLPP